VSSVLPDSHKHESTALPPHLHMFAHCPALTAHSPLCPYCDCTHTTPRARTLVAVCSVCFFFSFFLSLMTSCSTLFYICICALLRACTPPCPHPSRCHPRRQHPCFSLQPCHADVFLPHQDGRAPSSCPHPHPRPRPSVETERPHYISHPEWDEQMSLACLLSVVRM